MVLLKTFSRCKMEVACNLEINYLYLKITQEHWATLRERKVTKSWESKQCLNVHPVRLSLSLSVSVSYG